MQRYGKSRGHVLPPGIPAVSVGGSGKAMVSPTMEENPRYPSALLRTLGHSSIANHELEHAFDQPPTVGGKIWPRISREIAPSVGDFVFRGEQFNREAGKPLRHQVELPGKTHDIQWMIDQAKEHDYFKGRSMQDLIFGTSGGQSWFKQMLESTGPQSSIDWGRRERMKRNTPSRSALIMGAGKPIVPAHQKYDPAATSEALKGPAAEFLQQFKTDGKESAAGGALEKLLNAKSESDRKNYPAKHNILRDMIKRDPGSFRIDSEEGGIYGLTHAPTGFRIHMPRAAAPLELTAGNRRGADKMRTVELSGKVQGVGLRKTVHRKLDELGREGLAVNDARTGKVHMTVPEDVMESVLDAVRVQVKERGAPEPIVRQVKEKPKLRKTRLSPKQVEDFSTRGGLSRLAARDYAEKLKWLADRYRLKEEEEGGLVGRLPVLARKQVRIQEPIYEGQLSRPEDYFEDGPRPAWAKKADDKAKHVLVTGHSGSGKTTLSKQLAKKLGLPLFALDDDPRWDEVITGSGMGDVARNTPGTPENTRFKQVRKQMVLDAVARIKPHVIEGTQIAGSPEVWKDHRLVHVDTPELQVVRQRLGRDRLKPRRAGKMPPGSPMARERARVARVLIAGMRDELAQVEKDPRWEGMRAKKASVLDGVIEKKAEDDPEAPRQISHLAVPTSIAHAINQDTERGGMVETASARATGKPYEIVVPPGVVDRRQTSILSPSERAQPPNLLQNILTFGDLGRQRQEGARLSTLRPGLKPVYRSDDTLAGQVEKYYQNVPGGFARAVSESLKAQKRRTPGLGAAGGIQRRLANFPTWTGEDITRSTPNYYVPQQALSAAGLGGFTPRSGDYVVSSTGDATTLPELKAKLEPQERPYRAPPGKLEAARHPLLNPGTTLLRAAGTQVDSEGEFIPVNQRTGTVHERGDVPFGPGKAIPKRQVTREHEVSHASYGGGRSTDPRWGRAGAFQPASNSAGDTFDDARYQYMSTPAELDPRLAEIKRSYARSTGKLVNDAESARAAFTWWGEQLEKQPYLGSWHKKDFDRLMGDQELRAVMGKRMQEIVQNEPQQGVPGMSDQKVAVATALNAIIEKQAQPVYPRLNRPGGPVPVRGGNPLARQLFQGVGGPVESGVQHFSSPDDYFSEMMTIPYVGEAPLYAPKRSMWQNIKNLFTRPLRRRERQRSEREQLLRTQLAVQSLRGHQLGARSYPFGGGGTGNAALNEPGIHSMQTRPMSGYPRGLNYGQQTFQQAQARNLPFMSQMILNNPGGYRMVRDNGERSHWLHLKSGYTFDMSNNPDPSNLFDIRTIPPRQLGWARAQRWQQGRPSKDDLKHYGMNRISRRAKAST
jgi:acylphosphatase